MVSPVNMWKGEMDGGAGERGGGQRGSTGGQAPGRPLARRRRGASDVSRQSDAIGSTVRTRHRFCACGARSTFPCPPPLLRSSSSSCAYVFCCGQQQQKRIDRCHDGYADIAPRGSVGEKQIHFLSFWIEKWAIMERWRRIWRISNGVKGEIFRLFTVFSQIWRGSLREVFS